MLSAHPADNRFLIVDSYPFGRDTLRRALLALGAQQVDIAVSASVAMSMCKNVDYDVVLADYDLGKGRNGQQLLEELRSQQLLKNVSAFMVLTAETTRDIVLSTLEFQPDDYLIKPYAQNLLDRRVRRMLRFKAILHEVFQSIDNNNLPLATQDAENYLNNDDEFRSNALRILAELYYKTSDYERAQRIYDNELALRDSDWARLGLAQVYMAQEQWAEAEALCLALIDVNYLYIEAYENLSKIYLAQEQLKKAEEIMAKAVQVSPLSLRRQQWYANICESNNHFEAAATTWKNIIKISKNSRYESADHHLSLSRCLSDQCDDSNQYDNAPAAESLQALGVMRENYHVDGDNEIQSLFIESRVQLGKGNSGQSNECMQKANALYEKNPEAYSEQSQLEFAKTLSKTGDSEKAEQLLKDLAKHSKDPDILARLDKVLDEPVSKDGKARIVKLNRQGIKSFKAGEYGKAVDYFRDAQTFFPKNIELNLNLVQALLKAIKTGANKGSWEDGAKEAEHCLIQIRHISPQHKKYKNFQRLTEELKGLWAEVDA